MLEHPIKGSTPQRPNGVVQRLASIVVPDDVVKQKRFRPEHDVEEILVGEEQVALATLGLFKKHARVDQVPGGRHIVKQDARVEIGALRSQANVVEGRSPGV